MQARRVLSSVDRGHLAEVKRIGEEEFSSWARSISASHFELLEQIDVKKYWRELAVNEALKDAQASGEVFVLHEVAVKFKTSTGATKKKMLALQTSMSLVKMNCCCVALPQVAGY